MKALSYLAVIFCSWPLVAIAGPVPMSSGKEMKEVAPAPAPECNWSGFYVGVLVGGQWGHSEDRSLDGYAVRDLGNKWGYDESGVLAGGQVGYNFQWNWLVIGAEADLGYMNLDGRGTSRFDDIVFASDTRGETNSDFYTTIRGRLGFTLGHWLFYGTGGGIGVNYETRVVDDCDVFPCGSELLNAGKTEFNWGWTAGGGIEYMLNCHWTLKGEYLRYQLDDQNFSGTGVHFGGHFGFTGIGTEGNIVRAGLNYKF